MAAAKKLNLADDLLVRCTRGDGNAREEIAALCLPHIWKIVYLMCNGGPDVDDLTQNAVIDVLVGLPSYKGTGSFSGWVSKVTVRAVSRYYRKKTLKALIPTSETLESYSDPKPFRPDTQIDRQQLLLRVSTHLRKMKPKVRTALILSLTNGHTAQEVAEIVGCSLDAAKKRLARGRQDLNEKIERDPHCQKLLEGLVF